MSKKYSLETDFMNHKEMTQKYHGAVVPPIFQNSLFTYEDWDAIDKAFDDRTGNYIYTRVGNPGTDIAEKKIAKLANGEKAKLFASGMAAISAAVLHFVEPGCHIILVKNTYGPANTFISDYLVKKMGITFTFVSGEDIKEVENALTEKTKLIYLESPSSAVFSLQDIKAVSALAKSKNIKTIIDNTWATPLFQKPLEMGVDLEVHSCSKYLGGHSDIVAGVVIGSEKDINEISINEGELLGGIMKPFESWLILRSLRTFFIRMRQHQENALKVAQFLENHSKVSLVRYPGLKSHPQYELGKSQMSGYGGLLGFELNSDNLENIKAFFNGLEIFHIGVSWGGHESLIYAPAISYLKELPKEKFEAMGISLGSMRISVGLEECDDLIADLDNALKLIG